jgi:NAD(P)H-nitrite reductase large subunit
MLGGGLLNLKAAFALLERGVKVTLVVYSPEVLSQLMEPKDATLIRNALNNAGLTIKTGSSARRGSSLCHSRRRQRGRRRGRGRRAGQ